MERHLDAAPVVKASLARIDDCFSQPDVAAIERALQRDSDDAWCQASLQGLRKGSPLMLHVVLEQIRRGRTMDLADDLRMERDLVRNCFALRPGAASDTVEGIRALAVDKDFAPKWQPERIEHVTPEMVLAYFASPWPQHAHPLRHLR